ncbi:MAG: tRNA 2-thiouridine(34) synthase MnmA [bacterium]
MKTKSKTIVVGMSGGVDSSVTAAILKDQSYNVIGVFMYNWDDKAMGTEKINGCTAESDQQDVRKVCGQLNIPFYTFNFTKEYRRKVFNYFISEYKKNRTPNPDMLCNKEIKFEVFAEKAKQLGADLIATGHYAILKKGQLYRGKDESKDQSYFLAATEKKKFSNVLFPLGELKKEQVRKLAKKYKLVVADKKDSQGICFVGNIEVAKFLRMFMKPKKGKVITEEGEVIGEHDGAHFYTIGQRHGLGIASDLPYFITRTDVKKNIVYVGKGSHHKALFRKTLVLSKLNYFVSQKKIPKNVQIQIRYRHKAVPAKITKKGKKYYIEFKNLQRAVTPGQFGVIYKKNQVLAAGIIN